MAEAQSIFDTEFDPLPEPFIPEPHEFVCLTGFEGSELVRAWQIDFDIQQPAVRLPEPESRSQAFTLWFSGTALRRHQSTMEEVIATCLRDNPHSTLQIILEPRAGTADLSTDFLDDLLHVSYRTTSYLDRIYSLSPGRRKGAKRLVLLLEWPQRDRLGADWIESRSEYADIVWQSTTANDDLIPEELTEFEYFFPRVHI